MRGYPQELEDFVGAISERREPLSGGAPGPRGGRGDLRGVCLGGDGPPRGAAATMIPFAKGHGLGNDYIVMEEKDLKAPLSQKAIERICDRNWGVGSDGILLLVPSQRADFGCASSIPTAARRRSRGTGSGSSRSISGSAAVRRSRPSRSTRRAASSECQCRVEGGRMGFVTVEMGRATFRAPEIPMNGPDRDVVAVPLQLGDGTTVSVTAVSVGNPHCVTFCRAPRRGRLPATRAAHREPSVVSQPDQRAVRAGGLARNAGDPHLGAGAGCTLASGTSSCGAASAAVRNGLCAHGRVQVRMPGGELTIEVRPDWSLRLDGPVEEVYQGALSAEFAASL